MSENAVEKEAEYKQGEATSKDASTEANDKMIGEVSAADWKQGFSKSGDYMPPVPDLQISGAGQKIHLPKEAPIGGMKQQMPKESPVGKDDKGGPERQPEDNKLYEVDEKGNRISGDVAVSEKGGVPGSGDKGGPERQPEDNKLYEVDEKGNRISGQKGGPERHPEDNKLHSVDENGNRIYDVEVNGVRDTGLPESDQFDPSLHGDRQPLVTGDTFYRLRGTQFLDRENGDSFMLHPDGQFFLRAQDEVNIQSENGVTRITFRNGDEIEFDANGIRSVYGRGREARRRK